MDYDAFNLFCSKLPAAEYVRQWGGAHVWKVGGKVFAIGGWADDVDAFTFKTSQVDYELLRNLPGLRPAPYFASRGMKWIQQYAAPGLDEKHLKEELSKSYFQVVKKLTKKKRQELSLGDLTTSPG